MSIYFRHPFAGIVSLAIALDAIAFLLAAAFAWRDRNMNRSPEMGSLMIDWATSHYQEMFG